MLSPILLSRIKAALVSLLILAKPVQILADSFHERLMAGETAFEESRFEDAIQCYESAIEVTPSDSLSALSDAYNSIAISYFRIGKLDLALEYGQKSLSIDEISGDEGNMASTLNSLAGFCMSAKRNKEAEGYIDRAIEIEKRLGRKEKLGIRLAMKGEILTQMDRFDEAIELLEEALSLDRELGNDQKVAVRLTQLGTTLMHCKQFARAEQYLLQAVVVLRKYQNMPSLAMTLLSLSTTARNQHHLADARKYIQESIEIARTHGIRTIQMHGYMELANIYQDEKSPEAFDWVMQYVKLKDSINSEQVQQQISDLEVRYQTREKEQQIAMDEEIIANQRLLYWALAGLLALAVIAVLFLIRTLRLKNQNLVLRNRFTHLISHDLKNPAIAQQQGLQQLCRYIDLLDKDTMRQELSNLSQDADAQVSLLYDLLDWSSLQTGKLRYQPLSFDLESLAQEVLSQHRGQAQVKNIQLHVEREKGQTTTVTSDRRMVASILRNAVNNAIKFTSDGGDIEIRVEPKTIIVKDNGQGFDVAKQEHTQSSQRGTSNEVGTALGLSLARRLAKLCHAELMIDSQIGVGTTIKLSFEQ